MPGVGRFQVMATLQAARAAVLGLDDEAAKSWGLNRAIFYAAAKRGFRHAPVADRGAAGKRKVERPLTAGEDRGEAYTLGGEKAFLAPDLGPALRFAIGDEVQTPRDFEWQVERPFPDWPAAWREALELVKSAEPDDLNSQRRFYEQVYKPRRDKLAALERPACPEPSLTEPPRSRFIVRPRAIDAPRAAVEPRVTPPVS